MYATDFPTITEHVYEINDECYYVCQTCGHTVKIDRGGACIGVPIYVGWDDIPDSLATKTTLSKQHGRKLSPDQQPVGAKMRFNHRRKHVGYYPLYAIEDAIPKKKATPEQLQALEKARYMAELLYVTCSQCGNRVEDHYDWQKVTRKQWIEGDFDHYVCHICGDKAEAIEWAQDILAREDVVILDTETTDLDGEIIEIAIMDVRGNVLLNQRIKPLGEISEGAYRVHHISLDDLENEPTFEQVYPRIVELVKNKLVVIYNAQFDMRRLRADCRRHELRFITMDYQCAMIWYSQFVGDWSNYHDDYRWQPLIGGDHTALGDCKATLVVLKFMVGKDTEEN